MKHAPPSFARLFAWSVLLLGLAVGCGAGCGDPDPTPPPAAREMPDADRSTVEVSKALAIRANGKDTVDVKVTVLKADGTPLAGRTVKVTVSGEGNTVAQPAPTDAQGLATAKVTSTQAGTKTVTASVEAEGGPVTLTSRPSLEFITLPASRLAFTTAPSSGTAGTALGAFEVALRNGDGETVTGATQTVTVAIGSGPSAAALEGTVSVKAVNGVARFPDLLLKKAAQGYTLVASAAGLTGATSSPFTVAPAAPASLVLAPELESVKAGSPMSLELTVRDAFDNVVTGYTGTVRFSSDDASASLPADYTFTSADAGRHVFTNALVLKQAGTRQVMVKDSALTSLREVAVLPGTAARLVFTRQPANRSVRAAFDVEVVLLDAVGNRTSVGPPVVTLSLNKAVALTGSTSATPVDGVASFPGLSIAQEDTGYTLTASAAGLPSVPGDAFAIIDDVKPAAPVLTQGATTRTSIVVAWTAVGDDGVVGTASSHELRYSTSEILSDADFANATPVPLAAPKPAGSAESVTLTNLLSSTTYYVALQVTDNAGNTVRSTLPVSTPFSTATQVRFTVQPQNGTAGSALASIQVAIQDADGFTVGNASSAVTLTVQGVTGFGPFTVAAVKGVATFDAVRIDTAGKSYTLVASSSGLTPDTSTPFDITHAEPKHLELSGLGPQVTAGAVNSATVTVRDVFGNLAEGYMGTVHFESSDTSATLPADYAFTATDKGQHTFEGVVLRTSGARTLTVSATGLTSGTLELEVGHSAPSKLLLTGLPAAMTAGDSATVTVEVLDGFGNRATGYTGTVRFTSTDAKATLPAEYTFTATDKGLKTFSVTLVSAGARSLTVEDTADPTLSATANTSVQWAPVASLVLEAPDSTVAGAPFSAKLTALDVHGNLVKDYTGTVTFSADAAKATVPAAYTFMPSDEGSRQFDFVLEQAVSTTLTGTDGTLSASDMVSVSHAAPTELVMVAPAGPLTAGTSFTVDVTLEDAYDNVATGYTGTVRFTSSDGQAVLPADYAFVTGDAGRKSFSVTLKTSGNQTLTATDVASASLTASASFQVDPSAPTTLLLTGLPASMTAGESATVTVEARDGFDNRATGYTGTVHFTSTDAKATLPADYSFTAADQGLKTFSVTLVTAGSGSVTVQDTTAPALSATASSSVKWAALSSFVLEASDSTVAGELLAARVTALDVYGNTVKDYSGTVGFSADASGATVPLDYTFMPSDEGSRQFDFVLRKAVSTTLTVMGGILNASDTVSVSHAAPAELVMVAPAGPLTAGTSFTVDVTLEDAYDNVATGYTGTVRFTSSDGQAVLPADYAFVTGDAGRKSFSVTLKTSGNQTLTATDVASASLSASASFQVDPSAPTKLAFRAQPANDTVRDPLGPVTVAITDDYDNTVSTGTPNIQMALIGGNPGAILGGTKTVPPVNGVATFSDLTVDQQGTGFQLQATGTGLASATSTAFTLVDDRAPSAAPLTVASQTSIQVELAWTAVGDDGLEGTASSYELRYSTSPITDDVTFAAATAVTTGTPLASGSTEKALITGLTPSTRYYFALKVKDDVGNVSALSTTDTTTNADPCAGHTCTPSSPACAADGVSLITYSATCVDVNNTATCQESQTTTACTGTDAVCFKGACDTAAKPTAAQLSITEVMHNPSTGTTPYFEVLNNTSNLLNLQGLVVSESISSSSFTVGEGSTVPVVIDRNGTFVLAQNKDLATNGGVSANYAYGSALTLGASGQLKLANGTTPVEEVVWNTDFPKTLGKAMSLSSLITGTSSKAYPWYWCDSESQLAGGDFGTPNAANSTCEITLAPPVDYCAIQYPKSFPSGDGQYPTTVPTGSSWTLYSRFYEPGITDRNPSGNDFYPHVSAELGYGTDATNPAGWTWTSVSFNSGYSTLGNDDEMMGMLSIPTRGTYLYGFRYRFWEPATSTYTSYVYCDQNGVVTSPAGNYGSVAVHNIVISELSARGLASQTDEFIELYNPSDVPVDLNGWRVQYKSATGPSYSGSVEINPSTARGGNTVIPARGYYLLGQTNYLGTVEPDVRYTFDMAAAGNSGGNVRIGPALDLALYDDPATVDKVAYGSGNHFEGSAAAPAHPAAGGSLERKAVATSTSTTLEGGADALRGNGHDTDDNSTNVVTRTTREPQNASSAAESP